MIRSLNKLQPWAVALVRMVLGLAMLLAGWDKIIPAGTGLHRAHPLAGIESFCHFVAGLGLPFWLGYVSIATEFVGGACVLAGLLTRFWSFLIVGNLLVALWKVDLRHGYRGSEYALALLVMALLLVTSGSGALALDRRLGLA
jgi:putative oxidoreductase